ncbi:4Fe-4S dicluster domain-containing protein [Selenihalanaerobacter shriftii]|uniref:Methyl-viologen-reducing hydrogenase, delta subunit n=1 Tax=Selenihalanaerobacter shriftii TaxID=142842 RepID=A0A1T4PN70_9FIRM|nr:4Fe-4S dicluster domain-containing protein [Selenihalanaerobacter shriftii]SJZ92801.1 Methyl-viologen-reducing hydrogenase, delta subunit [Selenihalanaerobacter shriftii]
MLGLEKLLNFISDFDLTQLKVNQDLCINNIFNKKVCNKCYDVCPYDVITLEGTNLKLKKNNCNHCGFCYQVCPTGVFNILKESNGKLSGQIRSLAEKRSRIKIYCSQNKQRIKDGVEVICLGRLDERLLMESLLAGASDIWVVAAECQNCEMSIGEDLFKEVLFTCQELLKDISKQNRIYYAQKEPIKEENSSLNINKIEFSDDASELSLNRRDLFKILKPKVNVNDSKESQNKDGLDTFSETSISEKRVRLLKLLLVLDMRDDELQQIIRNNLSLVEFNSNCDFCQGCSNLCPTNALQLERKEKELSFTFNPLLCTSCRLCEISCLYNAIKVTKVRNEKIKLTEIDLEKSFEMFRGSKIECQECGDYFYTAKSTQEICFNCQYVSDKVH